jgi:hypothetical protein
MFFGQKDMPFFSKVMLLARFIYFLPNCVALAELWMGPKWCMASK